MSVLLITAALWAFPNLLNAGVLYKWIDEDGQIRYSDRLPVAQSQKKHQQLNPQGMVLDTKEAAKSKEELATEAAAKLKLEQEQAAQARIDKLQYQKDQVLLMTFSNENELELARNDRIEVLDSVIQLINKSLVSTQQKLEGLQTTAEDVYLSAGNEVPGGLAQRIEFLSRKLEIRSGQLDLKMTEKDKINEQFDIDLARYRLLKAEAD